MVYDCIIIGGGIAGLQAAIQLGRYKHKVLVVDSEDGRSTLCRAYHNILGYPDGISGTELRKIGKEQASQLGVEFKLDTVISVKKQDKRFMVEGKAKEVYTGRNLLIATGIMDKLPDFPGLLPCLGISVYVCPDCDGYEVKDKKTIVMGAGNVGANMALTISYWANEIIYINHEKKTIDANIKQELSLKGILYYEDSMEEVITDESNFKGVILESGEMLKAEHAFVAFGGNEVRSELAEQLGIHLHKNKHILVDPRTKMTNIENVWAAGDIVAHSEQVTIAMGEGSQAAIWIHKQLMNEDIPKDL